VAGLQGKFQIKWYPLQKCEGERGSKNNIYSDFIIDEKQARNIKITGKY
jgi:hypothetical protein